MVKAVLSTVMVAFFVLGCGQGIAAVDSGTYEGSVTKVVPAEQEIYVDIGEGRTIELYFNDDTTLTRAGESVDFSALAEGARVRVEVERVGNRLEPLSVEILE